MAVWGKVETISELRLLNKVTQELENVYRYTVITAKGTIFTEMVPQKVVDEGKVDEVLKKRALALDKSLEL